MTKKGGSTEAAMVVAAQAAAQGSTVASTETIPLQPLVVSHFTSEQTVQYVRLLVG
jgi:hypothetical protein